MKFSNGYLLGREGYSLQYLTEEQLVVSTGNLKVKVQNGGSWDIGFFNGREQFNDNWSRWDELHRKRWKRSLYA